MSLNFGKPGNNYEKLVYFILFIYLFFFFFAIGDLKNSVDLTNLTNKKSPCLKRQYHCLFTPTMTLYCITQSKVVALYWSNHAKDATTSFA